MLNGALDDIDDLRLRRELRVIVELLDEYRGIVPRALSDIAGYDLWDPLSRAGGGSAKRTLNESNLR
jgi:hypothetical protein